MVPPPMLLFVDGCALMLFLPRFFFSRSLRPQVPLGGFSTLQGMRGIQKFNIHKAFGGNHLLPAAHTWCVCFPSSPFSALFLCGVQGVWCIWQTHLHPCGRSYFLCTRAHRVFFCYGHCRATTIFPQASVSAEHAVHGVVPDKPRVCPALFWNLQRPSFDSLLTTAANIFLFALAASTSWTCRSTRARR